MAQDYQHLGPAPQAAEPATATRQPARPNDAAAFPGAAPGAAEAALAADPLAAFFYPRLREDPIGGVREVLFTAYVGDAPGFFAFFAAVRQAAQLDEHPEQLRAGLDLGLRACRDQPLPFELDVLLGLSAAAAADFVREVYGPEARALAGAMLERARASGDPAQAERAGEVAAQLGGGSWFDRLIDHGLDLHESAADWVDGATGTTGLTAPARAQTQYAAGALKAGGDLAGGLLGMVAHPLDTIGGVGEMVSHLPGSPLKLFAEAGQVIRGEKSFKDALTENPLDRGRRHWEDDLRWWSGAASALWAPYASALDRGRPMEAAGRAAVDLGSFAGGSARLPAKPTRLLAGALRKGDEATKLGQLAGVVTLEDLRGLLSPKARQGLAQQEALLPPATLRQLENAFRNADGTFDVERANRLFESKWVEEETFGKWRAAAESDLITNIKTKLKLLRDVCAETDGTNRPGATIGNGSTEAAILEEVRTGKPFKCPTGHHLKAASSIRALLKAIQDLQFYAERIKDSQMLAEIRVTLARAHQRVQDLQNGLDAWNRRAFTHPESWDSSGMSRTTPGWPTNPTKL